MITNTTADAREIFIIPSRTLRGSKREMVQDIDQAIVGLLALRRLIDEEAVPTPAVSHPRGRPSFLRRVFGWFAGPPSSADARRDRWDSLEA